MIRTLSKRLSQRTISMYFKPLLASVFFLALNCSYATVSRHTYHMDLKNLLSNAPKTAEAGTAAATFTITGGPSTIGFIQVFFYGDEACQTDDLSGVASIIDNSNGFPFTGGETVRLNKNAAFKLANNLGITTANIACMKLFINGSHETTDGINCQTYDNIECINNTCTSTIENAVNWDGAPLPCETKHAFIANLTTSTMTHCDVSNVNGELSNCIVQNGLNITSPSDITVNNGYVYTTRESANPDGRIVSCLLNLNTQIPENCADAGADQFNSPSGITINTKYAYIADTANDRLMSCSINNGTISNCGSALDLGLISPEKIAFHNNYGYITHRINQTVSKCSDDGDGTLSNCTNTPVGGFSGHTTGIAFYNNFAYIALSNTSVITKCDVNAGDGLLQNCTNALSTNLDNPQGIFVDNSYLYITNEGNNTITKCTITAGDGSLSSCAVTGSHATAPSSIYIY